MILIYRFVSFFVYPFLIVFIFFRKLIKKEHFSRYKEKIFSSCFNVKRKDESNLIWFHAASLGELKSILPIIRHLDKKNKNLEFLLTTTTLSSSILADDKFKKFQNVHHRFLPVDVGFLINNFLSAWRPKSIFLVDSEIWPNLILISKKRKIPISLINARITSKTYKRWSLFKKTAQYIFSSFDLCLVSNLETKNYLTNLNAKNIHFHGNIKLIQENDEEKIEGSNNEFLKKNKFWFAASTHKGEELFCLNTHIKLKEKIQDIFTIIAPRHINRVNEIKRLCDKLKLGSQILEKKDKILTDKEIIIVNSFGMLLEFFKFTKSVFIGKSLLKKFEEVGGQNPIDAAKLGCKIYHGPYVYNFREIYNILKENKISQEVNSSNEMTNSILMDLNKIDQDIKKQSSILDHLGQKTLEDTMKILEKKLFNENVKA